MIHTKSQQPSNEMNNGLWDRVEVSHLKWYSLRMVGYTIRMLVWSWYAYTAAAAHGQKCFHVQSTDARSSGSRDSCCWSAELWLVLLSSLLHGRRWEEIVIEQVLLELCRQGELLWLAAAERAADHQATGVLSRLQRHRRQPHRHRAIPRTANRDECKLWWLIGIGHWRLVYMYMVLACTVTIVCIFASNVFKHHFVLEFSET